MASSSKDTDGEYFGSLFIPLEEIESATNNFSDENLLTQGSSCKVYKGQLLDEESGDLIDIVVRKHLQIYTFLNELLFYWKLKHKNIVSLFKFAGTDDGGLIINKYEAYGRLDQHLSDTALNWMRRLDICVGVARALKYLHYDVIHSNIKSSKVLLDHNWEPKLHGFGFAFMANRHHLHLTRKYNGSIQYMDPAYENTGCLTHKSDVFSFGVLLFEVLFGREASIQNNDNWYFARLARSHYEEGKLDDLIHPDLRKQMVRQSLNIFAEAAYYCLKEQISQRPDMNQVLSKLENALGLQLKHTDRSEFAHLAIPLEEIVLATDNFADENLIKEGEFGKDYKGQMLVSGRSIDICARRLKHEYGKGDAEFCFSTEISMLSSLEHKNIISLVGFCAEDNEKIIIYEHAVHGSLDQHLSYPNLTWFQRLQICLGVARALSYIHYDVIHCDINSSKIFLDKDWEPKIFGFELSTKYPQSLRHRLLLSRHFNNTNMTPKYDVSSFGILMFEVVCGRKPMIGDHDVKEDVGDIIDPNLKKQMDTQSLAAFTKIASNCLNQQLVQRPTMDQIVKELEDVYIELQWKHENLKHSTAADEATSLNLLKMGWLEIPLSEISQATNGFDERYCIGSGGFGKVYKATIDVLDIQNLSSVEGKCKDELPKRSKTVAIKRIFHTQGEQGFLTEINLLTSCKHQNIVSLLGFSSQDSEMILVYEHAFEGSLDDYFRDTSKMIKLTWAQRLQICLGIARGINYLHTNMEGKPTIIHRDIKSGNILLDENLNAKVADFGLSKLHLTAQQARSTVYTKNIAGTDVYMDPEYQTTYSYKKESDIYSFGVVLFEILSGRPAYDLIYMGQNSKGLAPIARRRFNEGTLKELIDPKMMEEDKNFFTLNKGPSEESFSVFSGIAYKCLAETQIKRPTMETVIKELQNALNLQGETMVLTRFRLGDILSATENFSEIYCIGLSHDYSKVYKAEIDDFENKSSLAMEEKNGSKKCIGVAIKRNSRSIDVKQRFFLEIEMCTCYKHPNIVSLLGFCDEDDEYILVYEYASHKSLGDYLKNVDDMDNFTWTQRLHMCLGIARGLNHLHTKSDIQVSMTHGDIRSANILLGSNREPKIAYFGISKFNLANQEANTLTSTKVYWGSEFETTRIMKTKDDIYSLGVILFEIFCGRLAYDPIYIITNDKGLAPIARNKFNNGTIAEMLDPKLKISTSNKGPNQDSLDKFLKIANQCLEEAPARRPTMEIVVKELETTLNFQENLMKSLQLSLKDIELAQTTSAKRIA